HKKVNLVLIPFNGEKMEIIVKSVVNKRVASGYRISARISRAMKGSVDDVRLLSAEFHDINFTACRPGLRFNIFAQHPEGGPYTAPVRCSYSRLKTPVLLGKQALLLNPCRSKAVAFDNGSNYQIPLIIERDVCRTVGITL